MWVMSSCREQADAGPQGAGGAGGRQQCGRGGRAGRTGRSIRGGGSNLGCRRRGHGRAACTAVRRQGRVPCAQLPGAAGGSRETAGGQGSAGTPARGCHGAASGAAGRGSCCCRTTHHQLCDCEEVSPGLEAPALPSMRPECCELLQPRVSRRVGGGRPCLRPCSVRQQQEALTRCSFPPASARIAHRGLAAQTIQLALSGKPGLTCGRSGLAAMRLHRAVTRLPSLCHSCRRRFHFHRLTPACRSLLHDDPLLPQTVMDGGLSRSCFACKCKWQRSTKETEQAGREIDCCARFN